MGSSGASELDQEAIGARVLELAQEIVVKAGFCSLCQVMFDKWPKMRTKLDKEKDDEANSQEIAQHQKDEQFEQIPSHQKISLDFDTGLARTWNSFWGDEVTLRSRSDSISIEAAARRGCKCCRFIYDRIEREGLLDTFRIIERRLQYLENPGGISLVVVRWGNSGSSYILRLSYPRRKCGDVNSSTENLRFYSKRFSRSCTQEDRLRNECLYILTYFLAWASKRTNTSYKLHIKNELSCDDGPQFFSRCA
jgi:hypothetical protein